MGGQLGLSQSKAKYTHQLFVKHPINSKTCCPVSCSLSSPLPPPVAKKHDFFDSGLLYQFCINFRRRRRLSELLNEGEQDDEAGVAVPTQEDNHPDSPFVLRKSQLQQGNSAFQSGEKRFSVFSLRFIRFVVNVDYRIIILLLTSIQWGRVKT